MSDRLFTPRFIGLWLFGFLAFFSAFQLLPVIPYRIRDLGGNLAAAGSFLAVYTFSSAIAAPVMGSIADAIGRKRMLVWASALFILFSAAYGLVTNMTVVLLVGIVHGALWSGILSSNSAIAADVIPVSRRVQGLAYFGLAGLAAIATAPMVGLELYRRFGWSALCGELAVLSLLMAVWSSRLSVASHARTALKLSFRELWDGRVLRVALALTMAAFGYGGVTSYAAMLSEQRGIHPPSLFFTAFAAANVVVRLTTSHLGDRFGIRAVLYPSLGLITVSLGILAAAQQAWQVILSATLFGAGFGNTFPAIMTFLLEHTDADRRARTFGSFVLAFDAGIALGSLAIGAIGDRQGLGFAFGVAAVVSAFGIPIFAVASRGLIRGTEVAPATPHGNT